LRVCVYVCMLDALTISTTLYTIYKHL